MLGIQRLNQYFAERPLLPLLLAFLVPTAFRAIPELLAGPYPLGFDTVTTYAPLIAEARSSGITAALDRIVQSRSAPLFTILLTALSPIPVHPFILTKALGPLLLGLLSVFVYLFLRTLGLAQGTSLAIALFASLYFVTLRLSWDLYRNLFAYAFFFLAAGFIVRGRTPALFVVSALVVFLSHELVTALLVALLAVLVAWGLWRKREVEWVFAGLIVVGFLALGYYAHWWAPATASLIQGLEASPVSIPSNYLDPNSVAGFGSLGELYLTVLATGALILVPLLVWVRKDHFSARPILFWIAILLLAGFLPLVAPTFALPSWQRWLVMAALPLAMLAAMRIEKVRGKPLLAVAIVYLLLSGAYAFLPAESAAPIFASPLTVSYIPSSLLQNTGPLQDSPSTVSALQWLDGRASPGSVLLVHLAFSGWARLYAQGIEIRPYLRSADLDLSQFQGRMDVYTIWWAQDIGWYPTEEIDPRFVLAHAAGRIGVFQLQL